MTVSWAIFLPWLSVPSWSDCSRKIQAFEIQIACPPRALPSSARNATSTCGGSRCCSRSPRVALFGLTLIPDVLDKYGVIHIPSWLTMGSIDDARAILSAMMGAVATVLALIFSVALLVLSMVATLFGPRLLYRFLQDWVTQVTIGLFMGTFVYICLVFLVTHQDPQSTFIPQISLITSWVLVVAQLRVPRLLQPSDRELDPEPRHDRRASSTTCTSRPAGRTRRGRGEGAGAAPDDAAILRQAETGAIVSCPKSGYLQHVDHALSSRPRGRRTH